MDRPDAAYPHVYSWPHLAVLLLARLLADFAGSEETCAIIDHALRDDCLRRTGMPR